METILLGFKRHLIPIPWWLFQRALRRESTRTAKLLGQLDEEQRRVHHHVVRELPRRAAPLPPEAIAEAVALPLARVVEILDELERRLIFLFREGGRDVVWAYPVTAASTPHHLAFSSGERIDAA